MTTWWGTRRPALQPDERAELAERVNRYMTLPWGERQRMVEEVSRAYGVTGRTGYRYARDQRATTGDHRCRCAVCGQPIIRSR